MTQPEELLAELNQLYAEMKYDQAGLKRQDLAFVAPECRPQISSTQVKALLVFLVQKGVL